MAEPSSTSGGALGLAVALTAIGGAAGDALGPWAIVILGGLIGAGIGIAHLDTPTLRAAWWVLVRGLLLAVGFAGVVAVSVLPMLPEAGEPMVLFVVSVAIGFRQLRLLDDLRSLWPGGRPPPRKDDGDAVG